jgi:hypothetical protein
VTGLGNLPRTRLLLGDGMRKLLASVFLCSSICAASASDPNEECFKTQSAFHDLLIDSSAAMLNMTASVRNALTNYGLGELANKPSVIIFAIKHGGAEKAMTIFTAWGLKRRDPNYCSSLTEDECYAYTAKELRARSDPTDEKLYARMDLWPKLADDYIIVTNSTAIQYDPYLKRTICQGAYRQNIDVVLKYIAKIGEKISPQDLKVLRDLQGVQSMLEAAGEHGRPQFYSVQPDGNGEQSISLIREPVR